MERKVRTLNKEEKTMGVQDRTRRKCKSGINLKKPKRPNTGNAKQYSTIFQWMNIDLYYAPDICKYPGQLQFSEFSLHFVLIMEIAWDSTKEENPPWVIMLLWGTENRGEQSGEKKDLCVLQIALGARLLSS